MSTFNAIFTTIKTVCTTSNDFASVHTLSSAANVPREKMEYYINCLSDIGLIEYDKETNGLTLTDKGKIKDRVF